MIGLQVYTVRNMMNDPESCVKTLSRLKEIGYECIQLAGDLATMEMAQKAAKAVDLKVVGLLVSVPLLEENTDDVIALAKSCGARDVGVSGHARDEAEARLLVQRINRLARAVRGSGLSFSYHNHSHEFIRTESGKTVMDIFLEGFDASAVDLMPDTYWLQHGGIDVRDFIETHASRVSILHLKDLQRTADGVTFAAVGEGNLNMKGIVSLAQSLAIRDLIVEQDQHNGDDPMENVQKSYVNLISLFKH